MVIKRIEDVRPGEVLARPVKSTIGDVIVPEKTVLKEAYLELLKNLNIEFVEIEDEKISRPIMKIEEYHVKMLQSVLEQHVYNGKNSLIRIQEIAKGILKLIDTDCNDYVYQLESYNTNLYMHTIEVTVLAILLGRDYGLNETALYDLAVGTLLHDLGLRYITVEYQNCNIEEKKPEEIFQYKKHTIYGYTALENEKWVSESARKIVLSHHEFLDGTGYPLKQKNMGVECEIVQICDKFDCMVSGIGFKRKSREEVIQYLDENSDKKFNKKMVQAFKKMLDQYVEIV